MIAPDFACYLFIFMKMALSNLIICLNLDTCLWQAYVNGTHFFRHNILIKLSAGQQKIKKIIHWSKIINVKLLSDTVPFLLKFN